MQPQGPNHPFPGPGVESKGAQLLEAVRPDLWGAPTTELEDLGSDSSSGSNELHGVLHLSDPAFPHL